MLSWTAHVRRKSVGSAYGPICTANRLYVTRKDASSGATWTAAEPSGQPLTARMSISTSSAMVVDAAGGADRDVVRAAHIPAASTVFSMEGLPRDTIRIARTHKTL